MRPAGPGGRPLPTKKQASLAAREDGSLRIAVVADTHSAPHPRAHEQIQAMGPDAILHAGDIGDLAVLDGLRTIAPLFAVRGNIDGRAELPDVLTLDVTSPRGLLARILLTHIAVNGPKLRADVVRMAHAHDASMVVCGHSHVPFVGSDRGFTVLNPGSIGPRRFQLPIVWGRIDISPREIRIAHVDCETGLPWRPGASAGARV